MEPCARPCGADLRRRAGTIQSSGRVFNEWLSKSRGDLALLTTELATGPYPYAGIPWFSTAFGRDAIITSLQMLWLDPALAPRRAPLSGRASGDGDVALPRRGAGQDHARDPKGGDGASTRAAIRQVLRRSRHDAAVCGAGRCLRRAHGRPRPDCGPVAVAGGGDGLDRGRARFQQGRVSPLRQRRRDGAREPGVEGQR